MIDKFLEITRSAVNLLCKIYENDPAVLAFILKAQADEDADNLLKERNESLSDGLPF